MNLIQRRNIHLFSTWFKGQCQSFRRRQRVEDFIVSTSEFGWSIIKIPFVIAEKTGEVTYQVLRVPTKFVGAIVRAIVGTLTPMTIQNAFRRLRQMFHKFEVRYESTRHIYSVSLSGRGVRGDKWTKAVPSYASAFYGPTYSTYGPDNLTPSSQYQTRTPINEPKPSLRSRLRNRRRGSSRSNRNKTNANEPDSPTRRRSSSNTQSWVA